MKIRKSFVEHDGSKMYYIIDSVTYTAERAY